MIEYFGIASAKEQIEATISFGAAMDDNLIEQVLAHK